MGRLRLAITGAVTALWLGAAPEAAAQPTHGAFAVETLREGERILAVAQDGLGYVWIAGERGLCRADGMRIACVEPPLIVGTLALARDGSVIAGGGGTLFVLERGGSTPTARALRSLDAPTTEITALAQGEGGTYWIGTSSGLVRWSGGTDVPAPAFGVEAPVRGVLLSNRDAGGSTAAFVATARGLVRIAGTTVTTLTSQPVRRVASDGEGGATVVTDAGEVLRARIDATSLVPEPGVEAARDLPALAVGRLRDGGLWVGGDGAVVIVGPTGRRRLTVADGLPHPQVTTIHEDVEGGVWLGTQNGLALVRREPAIVPWGKPEGLGEEVAFSVLPARDGRVWTTTPSHVVHLRDGRFGSLPKDLLPDIRSLAEAPDGAIWAAGLDTGLHRIAPPSADGSTAATARAIVTMPPLTERGLRAVAVDRDGLVWIALRRSGVAVHRDGRTAQVVPFGPIAEKVMAIVPGAAGGVWLATEGAGLWRVSPERAASVFPPKVTITRYGLEHGLPSLALVTAHEDREGTLWAGTLEHGLVRFADGRGVAIGTGAGLPDGRVYALVDDGLGRLWVGSSRGVFAVAKTELHALAQGRLRRVRAVSYGLADGLRSTEIVRAFPPSAARGPDGTLWFPTLRGLAAIRPDRLARVGTRPQPVVEAVSVDGVARSFATAEPGASLGRVVAPAGRGDVVFRIGAPSFSAPHRLRLAARLAGVDHEPRVVGADRELRYQGLAPGRYVLSVTVGSEDSDGPWAEGALGLELSPPFHRTVPFYGLLAFAAALALLAAHGVRVAQVRRAYHQVLAERERIAREIHDTLEQDLVGVRMQLDIADLALGGPAGGEGVRPALMRAGELLTEASADLRDVIWSLRARPLDGRELAEALGTKLQTVLRGTGIRLELATDEPAVRLPERVGSQLYPIALEAVTNALKHAAPTTISVSLSLAGPIVLAVRDDGRGFDPAATTGPGHHGLEGLRARAARMGGKLEVRSAPGKGTEIRVEVPSRAP